MATKETPRPLPTLADLHHKPEQAFKKDQFNLLLNQPAHNDWIKKHPYAKTKNDRGEEVAASYIPIDKVEFLLTYIFQQWKCEVISIASLFNSVCAHVRLHYMHPVTGEWLYHDGVGACPVQTDKGASAADLSKIKNAAIQMAAPASVSYALKDAAEHLGTLFGRDLNRRDIIQFAGTYEPAAENEEQEQPPLVNAAEPVKKSTGTRSAVSKQAGSASLQNVEL